MIMNSLISLFYPSMPTVGSAPTEFGLAFEQQLGAVIKKIKPQLYQFLPLAPELNEYILSFLKISELTNVAKVNQYSKLIVYDVIVQKIRRLGYRGENNFKMGKEHLEFIVKAIADLRANIIFAANFMIYDQHTNKIDFKATLESLRESPSEKIIQLFSYDFLYEDPYFYEFGKKLLYEARELPDERDRNQDALILNKAFVKRQLDIVKMLLDKGVSPVSNDADYTPLHLACDKEDIDMAEEFISAGAEINYASKGSFHDGASKSTALHVVTYRKNIKLIELLLKHGANPDLANENGNAPLLNIARDGDSYLDMIELLLNYGANINFINPKDKGTAVNVAAVNGQYMAVELFLRRGADPSISMLAGYAPLHYASSRGYIGKNKELGRLLPFHPKKKGDYFKTVQVLLKYGVSINQRSPKGKTPLYMAASGGRGSEQILQILLKHGADPHIHTNKGYFPLHRATMVGNLIGVKLLLDHGADALRTNFENQTARDMVIHNKDRSDIADELLKRELN